MVGKLKGKVGADHRGASGIGRPVAVRMAREGADIAMPISTNTKTPTRRSGPCTRRAPAPSRWPGDIGEEAVCQNSSTARSRAWTLNILVNNAAEQHETDDPLQFDTAQMQRTFRTNAFSLCI